VATLTNIYGYIYDAQGDKVRRGILRITLQQDMISVDGTKVAPFTVIAPLEALSPPTIFGSGVLGTPGSTTYSYKILSVNGDGQKTVLGDAITFTTGNATLSGSNYTKFSWPAVPGAVEYEIYGRTTGSYLYMATVSTPFASFTPQNAITYNLDSSLIGTPYFTYEDDGSDTPSGSPPSTNTAYGYVSVNLYATVGASPSGLAYLVEYDADPDDLTRPINQKNGYWRNYWSVPNTASVAIGSFTSALRGQPSANYQPVGSAGSFGASTFTVGQVAEDTNKVIQFNQVGVNKPGIRYNETSGKVEVSHDGTTWLEIATV
jgi:hypothetical protein